MLVFCAVSALLLLGPLYTARAYQRGQVARILEQYAACSVEAVDTECEPFNDWLLFQRTEPAATPYCAYSHSTRLRLLAAKALASRLLGINPLDAMLTSIAMARLVPQPPWNGPLPWQVQTEYYMAEFSESSGEYLLVTRYASPSVPVDFSQVLSVLPTNVPGQGVAAPCRYFFPVYEVYGPMDTEYPANSFVEGLASHRRGEFLGLVLPEDEVDNFRGLFRVTNRDAFRLLLNITVPSDRRAFRAYQALPLDNDPVRRYACEDDAAGWCNRALAKFRMGERKKALRFYEAALALRAVDTPVNAEIVAMLKELGAVDLAVRAFVAAIGRTPDSDSLCGKLDSLVSQAGFSSYAVVDLWHGIAARCRDTAPIYCHLGTALLVDGQAGEAVEAYEKALTLEPDRLEVRQALLRATEQHHEPE